MGIWVVKAGGRALEAPEQLLADVAAWTRQGERVVLVHGGGQEVTRWLEAHGLVGRFVDGLRVTEAAELEVVTATLAGLANKRLVAQLRALGVDAVGLSGADGLVQAEQIDAATWGLVGQPSACDVSLIEQLWEHGKLPVVAPVCEGGPTGLLNVNADTVAAALAAALGADALLLATDVPGIRAGTRVLRRTTLQEIEALVAQGEIAGGMLPKVQAVRAALAQGVQSVCIFQPGEGSLQAAAAGEAGTCVGAVVSLALKSAQAGDAAADALIPLFARQPVGFVRGRGSWLWDEEGRQYLDFGAGIAVSALGHAHPRLVQALRAQVGNLLHTSNLYRIPNQERLAAKLRQLAGDYQAFFCNSGAEAVEAALKLALLHGRPEGRRTVVAFENSFHGRTLGAVAVTGQPKYRQPYEPLTPPTRFVPYNDLRALKEAVDGQTAAVIVEAVQGEGGVHPADPAFLRGLRAVCDETGALLIFDEIQTGIGRTGSWFAFQHYGVVPDLVTLAKGLGGGVPIGALLARPQVAAAFAPGTHGSTFGGNPLACAAGLAVLDAIERYDLRENARRQGARLREGLQELAHDVRGVGLLIGCQTERPASEVIERCRERGLIVLSAGSHTLRLAPPLTVTDDEVERALQILRQVLVIAA